MTVDTETTAIIGGGDVGCDVASYLADRGTTVTILEQADRIVPEKELISRIDMLEQFEENELIEMKTGERVVSIGESGVITEDDTKTESTCRAEMVVLAMGHDPNDGLASKFASVSTEVYVVGDARESRNIYHATLEGTEAALSIGAADPTYSPRF